MTGTELVRGGTHLPTVTDDGFLEEVRTQIAPKATDAELRFFANVVAKTQLDPWSRQVYLIPRWDGRVKREVHRPQVSIDGLRLVAERSGNYEGQTPVEWCGRDGAWRDTWFESEAPAAARVGVFKSGRSVATYAVAHFDEYVVTGRDGKPSGLWKDKPRVMIAKCAEALALRKVFPQETSGLYTSEEMGRADVESTAVEIVEPAEITTPAATAASEGYKPSNEAVQALLTLAAEKGLRTAQAEGQDADQLFRFHLAMFGLGNEGDVVECVAAITDRSVFESLWGAVESCDQP